MMESSINLNNQQILSLVIPCYGKDNNVVRDSLNSVKEAIEKYPKKIEAIFVYKNSDKFNYDWVEKEFSNFKIIKSENTSFKRTGKIKLGIEEATYKYLYTFDPDDFINLENLEKILNFLENHDEDFVLMNYVWTRNIKKSLHFVKMFNNNKIKTFGLKRVFGNYNCLYKTQSLKNNIKHFHLDEFTQMNDNYLILVALNKAKITFMEYPLIIYLRGIGESKVNTFLKPEVANFMSKIVLETSNLDFDLKNKNVREIISKSYSIAIKTIFLGFAMKEKISKSLKKSFDLVNTLKEKNLLTSKNSFQVKTIVFLSLFSIPFFRLFFK